MNVLLFDGQQVVSAEDLENVKDRSQYKADGKIHEQERDVSKLLKSGNTTITLFGFEHQTEAEKFMPVRQIGYDVQSYYSVSKARICNGCNSIQSSIDHF